MPKLKKSSCVSCKSRSTRKTSSARAAKAAKSGKTAETGDLAKAAKSGKTAGTGDLAKAAKSDKTAGTGDLAEAAKSGKTAGTGGLAKLGRLAKPARRPKKSEVPPERLCEFCDAKCCRYFALPIDKPSTFEEFDYVRWYLLHERASVFVEDGDWFLLVHTPCKELGPDNRCQIYETRPQICREYSTARCEYDDLFVFEQYFETPEQVEEYAVATLGPRPGTEAAAQSLKQVKSAAEKETKPAKTTKSAAEKETKPAKTTKSAAEKETKPAKAAKSAAEKEAKPAKTTKSAAKTTKGRASGKKSTRRGA